jgi:hypothetical protein
MLKIIGKKLLQLSTNYNKKIYTFAADKKRRSPIQTSADKNVSTFLSAIINFNNINSIDILKLMFRLLFEQIQN